MMTDNTFDNKFFEANSKESIRIRESVKRKELSVLLVKYNDIRGQRAFDMRGWFMII